jgi:hypothetical protein
MWRVTDDLLRSGVAVEFADKSWAVFRRPVSQVRNEGFNLLASRIPQIRSAAGISGVSFDEIGIELMLTNQKAEATTEAWVAILMTIIVRSRSGLLRIGWTKGLRFPPKLFDRAETDAIGLSKSTIDSARFRDPHLRASDEERHA